MGRTGRAPESEEVKLRRLEKAIAQLRPVQREVLLLCRREGLAYRQIAERKGMSLDQVERHLADALYELDRRIERAERPWWRFW
ncbi:MAG TPA: sigma factor-like helix-turn-helix DNA-binding protein [Allosphingosinicella sp.]